jgi:uncharacterized protein (TIGR02145 family)
MRDIQLESKNFHVDSVGWKQHTNHQGVIYLQNPEKDIWEYVGRVPRLLVGHQLFTWFAGMRETEKVGKRMPTDEEWNIVTNNGKDLLNLKKVLPGYRTTDGTFGNLGMCAHFWSFSVSACLPVWRRYLNSGSTTVFRYPLVQEHGFSVRCRFVV